MGNLTTKLIRFVDLFFENVSEVFTGFGRGTKNLYLWFSIIWNDRSYDYSFIYVLLKKKLELTFLTLNKDLSNNQKIELVPLENCIKLLNSLIADEYASQEFAEFDARWGKSFFTKKEGNLIQISYENITNEKDELACNKQFTTCSKKAEQARSKDRISLFNILKYEIESWWS